MMIVAEFFLVLLKVLWAFVTAGAKWVVRPKEKSVAGQVCVITGAGSGLGRLFAQEFARRRAVLVLWDINSRGNEETADMVRQIYRELDNPMPKDGPVGGVEEVPPFQPQVYTYVCDVGKRESVYTTAEKVRREVGEVDMLINNAGVVSGHHLLECPDELIERTMVVNCHAHFWKLGRVYSAAENRKWVVIAVRVGLCQVRPARTPFPHTIPPPAAPHPTPHFVLPRA
ncbi:unnamed protein product [Merluccius merluccius]